MWRTENNDNNSTGLKRKEKERKYSVQNEKHSSKIMKKQALSKKPLDDINDF